MPCFSYSYHTMHGVDWGQVRDRRVGTMKVERDCPPKPGYHWRRRRAIHNNVTNISNIASCSESGLSARTQNPSSWISGGTLMLCNQLLDEAKHHLRIFWLVNGLHW
ncbi:hypothetical protein M404DRAFT_845650 [Pisolithus tinctorius Marx 270]|uniref:Uncharacterized protein n=1 Tax=Pisolithus tinctorius Marx 270 TaxID=870435 RepID=A0A0C3JM63_PISTI|nr:hypothetical protein M404DRAFT_845650 [Pisolithus tinctorius Marx 270]